MRTVRIPLVLVLYGVLFVTSLPLLIVAVTRLSAIAESRLTIVGSSMLSLVVIGLVAIGALYTWLKIAKWLIRERCRDRANVRGST